MDRFAIRGGVPLRGRVEASGSKNAVLALMAASLLTEDEVVFSNVPGLRDVDTMTRILEQLGLPVARPAEGEVVLGPGGPTSSEAPYDLVRTMRASFMVLGPLLASRGQARGTSHEANYRNREPGRMAAFPARSEQAARTGARRELEPGDYASGHVGHGERDAMRRRNPADHRERDQAGPHVGQGAGRPGPPMMPPGLGAGLYRGGGLLALARLLWMCE